MSEENINSGELTEKQRLNLKSKINTVSSKHFGSLVRDIVSSNSEERANFYESLYKFMDAEDIFEQKIIEFVSKNFVPEMKEFYEKALVWAKDVLVEQGYYFNASVIIRAFKNKESLLLSPNTTCSLIVSKVNEAGFDLTQMLPPQKNTHNAYDVIFWKILKLRGIWSFIFL